MHYNHYMGRPPQDEKRKERLLEIALGILAKQGLSGLSFQKVADQASVSQSTVMHYFPNKDVLFSEISTFVAGQNRSYVEAQEKLSDDAEERLRKFLIHNFQWAEKNAEQAQVIILISYLSMVHPEFQSVYNVRLKSVREKILGILLAGHREKLFFFNVHKGEEIASLFHNFLVSAITNALASRETSEKKKFAGKVDLMIQGLLKK